MAVFRCKMCSADLDISSGSSVVECEYCGTKQTVPSADDEKKVNLFNRANKMRSFCEFDNAHTLYENIVSEFPDEAEAYWGLCLCKYGVEYVDDPKTKKKIPTLHRASLKSILDDSDYKAALDKSDVIAREQYELEAKEIDRLNNRINKVASNEKPYDVFICYKETDEFGERTKDSVRAQEIYDVLDKKGYKVFFARITLEDKLGEEYEPYIFAALNSSKVMLAIGTKSEYFNATWVKNEWSRYLKLMEQDRSKKLFPCYSDIDAYELPNEFKNLQAQNMAKMGFEQDLARNIEKIIPLKKPEQVVVSPGVSSTSIEVLVPNAKRMMELNNIPAADKLYTKITELYPDDYHGWWGKILCLTKNLTDDNFEKDEFDTNYNVLRQVADEDTMLDLNTQLSVFFKNVMAVDWAKIDVDDLKEKQEKAEAICSDYNKEKVEVIRKANNYSASCNRNIDNLRKQKSDAQHENNIYTDCREAGAKARTALTALSVIFVLLIIVFIILLINTIATGGNFSIIFFLLLPLSVKLAKSIVGANVNKHFANIGVNLKSQRYGRSVSASLKNANLINLVDSTISKARALINECTNEIERLEQDVERNDSIAKQNVKFLDSKINDCNTCSQKISESLALPQDNRIDYWYTILCKNRGIESPILDRKIVKTIEDAEKWFSIITGEADYSILEDNDDDYDDEYDEQSDDEYFNENDEYDEQSDDDNEPEEPVNEAVPEPVPVPVAAPEPEPVPVQEDIPKPVEIPTSNDNSDRKGSFCTGCGNFIPLGQRFCGICGQKNEEQEA